MLLAQACAPRLGFSGPAREPELPALARAVAAGQLGTAAASLVRETIQARPAPLDAQDRTEGEATLVREPGSAHVLRLVIDWLIIDWLIIDRLMSNRLS